MKKNIVALFCIISLSMMYASGNAEILDDYVDLGNIDVVIGKQYYDLLLPYKKPEGVTKVPTKDEVGIIFHELIVDGKKVRPRKMYFTAIEMGKLREESTPFEMESRTIMLSFWALGVKPDETIIIEGLFYNSAIWKLSTPEQYNIPYGAKEVFLRYSILYPYDVIKHSSNINLDQEYVVRWTMEWP